MNAYHGPLRPCDSQIIISELELLKLVSEEDSPWSSWAIKNTNEYFVFPLQKSHKRCQT